MVYENCVKSLMRAAAALALICGTWAGAAKAQDLRVTVENLSASGGLFLTPVWIGFHDGTFDLYDQGAAVSAGVERLAEDGNFGVLSTEFQSAQPSGNDGVVFGPTGFAGAPVLDSGEIASTDIAVDSSNRYFSYASMVIPSNDAFIANGSPTAYEVFDAGGNFTGPITFLVLGSQVLDAGTEDNTEMDAAFINQTGPNLGDTTVGGVVSLHPGFIDSVGNPGGTPIILGGTNAAGELLTAAADFTSVGFEVARITITQVPEPTTLVLAVFGAIALCGNARRNFRI